MTGAGGRLARRAAVRAGAVLATSAGLAACARPTGGKSAAPTVQQAKIVLGMRAWGVGSGAAGTPSVINALLYDATKPWRDTHPGVDIRIIENTGGPQGVVTSIIAGTGPDIYHSWHPADMFADNGAYAADLRPYIRQSNADLSVFNKAQMDLFVQPDGIRALPYYLGISTLAVNEGLLDQLGLTYPASGWTYQDFAQLATNIARAGRSTGAKQQVYGSDFGLGSYASPSGYFPPDCVLRGFGGSYYKPGNPAQANFSSSESINAVQWVYQLAQSKAITGPGASGNFTAGTLGMTWAPSFFLPSAATGWRSLKWRYYPMPKFPVTGETSAATIDLWALNPQSKNIDLAWDLLHWCAFEPAWQTSQMEIFLLSPALTSLWEHWLTLVPQIAPPLASKNLKAFADIALGNQAYAQPFMRYQATEANTLINSWGQQMWSRKVGVSAALTGLAQQLDALETTWAQKAQSLITIGKQFPTAGPRIAPVPAGI